MRWIESTPATQASPMTALRIARLAAEHQPDALPRRIALARASYAVGEYRDAIAEYDYVRERDAAAFGDWNRLADAWTALREPAEVLRICELAVAAGAESARLRLLEGRALRRLGRYRAATKALRRCVALGDYSYLGLAALLRPLAAAPDGGPLLDYCDSLPPRLADSPIVRANRAIALSRLGRTGEARGLIDPDRHVVQVEIAAPDGFAGLDAFHAALEQEVMSEIGRHPTRGNRLIVFDPPTQGRPALVALHASIREAMRGYLDSASRLGLDAALPATPAAVRFAHGFTALWRKGTNGEHIHRNGYISSVYHVRVPSSVARATDGRGALTIGGCTHYTRGYQGCWGVRRFAPRPGVITLFPSHFFHNVVPPRSSELRISITADLRPGVDADEG